MSSKKKTKKRAYCSNCCKNVPHFRRMGGRFQKTFGKYLLKLRIGPWYCYHCRRREMILPAVRADAANYRFSRSKTLVNASDAETSQACFADAEPNENWEMAAAGGDFNEGNFDADQDEHLDSLNHNPVNGSDGSNSIPTRGLESQVQRDREARSEVSFPIDDPSVYYVDASSSHSITLEESAGVCSAVSDLQPAQNGFSKSELDAIPEIERVGDTSRSTEIKRFTEKYRDAVVAKILEGKASISSLNQEYSEAELLSWIADKAKRQEERIVTLELNRWKK